MDEEIRNLLEAKPGDGLGTCLGDKGTQEDNQGDTHREQRAILFASGTAKEMIGIELTQDQVKVLVKNMLKNISKDMKLHYLQKHAKQWLIHFSSFHARL